MENKDEEVLEQEVAEEKAEEPEETVTEEKTKEPAETVTEEKTEEPAETVTKEKTEEPAETVTEEKTEEPTEAVTEETPVIKKKKGKNVPKILFLVYHIAVILVLTAALIILLVPDAKVKLLQTPLGKYITRMTITEEVYKNVYDKEFKEEEVIKNEDIDTEILDEYINIALFGLDSRYQSLDSTNSDTIMIVSIGKKNKDVKLVSIYRDSYQKIYGKNKPDYNKINSAYAKAGAEGAISTLNMNYDLDIEDYVAINFNGLATVIDLLGGVDVSITEHERQYINGYLTETRKITGLNASDVYGTGMVHLNGLQATAYCRIRYTSVTLPDGTVYNNDFGRTARQRLILTQLIEKAKGAGLTQVLRLVEEVFKSENEIFKTSMSYEEIMDLIPVVLEFSLNSTSGYPFTYDDSVMINGLSNVVVAGHSYNVTKLHEYLFGDYEYIPSKNVLEIDEEIKDKTGIQTMLTEEDKQTEESQKEIR